MIKRDMSLRSALVCLRGILQQHQQPTARLHASCRCMSMKSTPAPQRQRQMSKDDLENLFAEPTWSVQSLLPSTTCVPDVPQVTPQQLHHLLRLSALPLPGCQEIEDRMISTLNDQLHFVGNIQKVDTNGVKPLTAIRDETLASEEEQSITLKTLQEDFAKEKVIGKHYKRIQRDTTLTNAGGVEGWDVLGSAERKVGRFFVVDNEHAQE